MVEQEPALENDDVAIALGYESGDPAVMATTRLSNEIRGHDDMTRGSAVDVDDNDDDYEDEDDDDYEDDDEVPNSLPGERDISVGSLSDDESFASNPSNKSTRQRRSGKLTRRSSYHSQNSLEEHVLKRGTRAVCLLKVAVVGLLVIAALVVSVFAFFFVRAEQLDNFHVQYNNFASEIADQFQHKIDLKLWTAYTASSIFSSRFGDDNHRPMWTDAEQIDGDPPWPEITMPDFEQQMMGASLLANAKSIMFSPLVTEENRESWEIYAAANLNSLFHGSNEKPVTPSFGGIYRLDEHTGQAIQERTQGPYLPIWQVAPLSENYEAIMFNQLSDPVCKRAIDAMVHNGVPSVTEVILGTTGHHYHKHEQPEAILFFPVYDGFNDASGIVGSLSIEFGWESFFTGMLPAKLNNHGITLVLETNTGQQLSFQVRGENCDYLGAGDLHQRQFDRMELTKRLSYSDLLFSAGFTQANVHMNGNRGASFEHNRSRMSHSAHGNKRRAQSTTNGRVDDLVSYTLRIYPSEGFREHYVTNQPAIFASAIALIFFFASAVFLIYDWLVERRQNFVMESAARSHMLVHSLFPKVVRERVFKSNEERLRKHYGEDDRNDDNNSLNGNNSKLKKIIPRRMSDLVGNSAEQFNSFFASTTAVNNQSVDSTAEPSEQMIAELFPETTVMFADIVGFTAWSSEREPSQVFQLLEAIYGEFDTIAHKRGVFKVGTIGDCYIAVTGLPEPRDDHALVLARFAVECLSRMNEMILELESLLGPGTAELGMRFGLHSGSVTAGVLRGEKSRFDLFGDTMNTASRIESTGQKNMIQVSQQTADLLFEAGKDHWLMKRDTLVTAKGKGEMQTYWLRRRSRRRLSHITCGSGASEQGGRRSSFVQIENLVIDTNPSEELGMEENNNNVDPVENKKFLALATVDSIEVKPDIEKQNCRSDPSGRRGSFSKSLSESWINRGLESAFTMDNTGVERLIDWNVFVLEGLLLNVVSCRSREQFILKRKNSPMRRGSRGRNLKFNPTRRGSGPSKYTSPECASLDQKRRTRRGSASSSQYSDVERGLRRASLSSRCSDSAWTYFDETRQNQQRRRSSAFSRYSDAEPRNVQRRSSGMSRNSENIEEIRRKIHPTGLQTTASRRWSEVSHSSCISRLGESDAVQDGPSQRHRKRSSLSSPAVPEITSNVRSELRLFVTRVASKYRTVAFHNFEHASHVTLSANKLIRRISCPTNRNLILGDEGFKESSGNKDMVNNSAFGISSDPLAQFAVVFAALVHDVDHRGVTNAQLVKEGDEVALKYSNKSVNERHSIDVAWDMLMEPTFDDLRKCMFSVGSDVTRFRQILTNALLATDIADVDMVRSGRERWEEVFHPDGHGHRADPASQQTVVLEHLIQASDVAHTMQHWLTYLKWNERLYKESWLAYINGRAEKNPSLDWYENELFFFDHYVLPLATRLKQCGIFGATGEESLVNARENRRRWLEEGEAALANMMRNVSQSSRM